LLVTCHMDPPRIYSGLLQPVCACDIPFLTFSAKCMISLALRSGTLCILPSSLIWYPSLSVGGIPRFGSKDRTGLWIVLPACEPREIPPMKGLLCHGSNAVSVKN
jgi:hypothetical protein